MSTGTTTVGKEEGFYTPVFLPDPIEEYVKDNVGEESTFQDLFEATEENVDLRTEVTLPELVIVSKIKVVDDFIKEKLGAGSVYDNFLNKYLRLRISTDRKSRAEFVDINRKERFEQNLQRFGNFQNLAEVKK